MYQRLHISARRTPDPQLSRRCDAQIRQFQAVLAAHGSLINQQLNASNYSPSSRSYTPRRAKEVSTQKTRATLIKSPRQCQYTHQSPIKVQKRHPFLEEYYFPSKRDETTQRPSSHRQRPIYCGRQLESKKVNKIYLQRGEKEERKSLSQRMRQINPPKEKQLQFYKRAPFDEIAFKKEKKGAQASSINCNPYINESVNEALLPVSHKLVLPIVLQESLKSSSQKTQLDEVKQKLKIVEDIRMRPFKQAVSKQTYHPKDKLEIQKRDPARCSDNYMQDFKIQKPDQKVYRDPINRKQQIGFLKKNPKQLTPKRKILRDLTPKDTAQGHFRDTIRHNLRDRTNLELIEFGMAPLTRHCTPTAKNLSVASGMNQLTKQKERRQQVSSKKVRSFLTVMSSISQTERPKLH